jgi:hypothetical protein
MRDEIRNTVNTTQILKRAIAGIALAAFALRGLGLVRFGASGCRPGRPTWCPGEEKPREARWTEWRKGPFQIIGGGRVAGPNRSALVFDEVRRHRPYSGNSRIDSPAGIDHRRARNRITVRT